MTENKLKKTQQIFIAEQKLNNAEKNNEKAVSLIQGKDVDKKIFLSSVIAPNPYPEPINNFESGTCSQCPKQGRFRTTVGSHGKNVNNGNKICESYKTREEFEKAMGAKFYWFCSYECLDKAYICQKCGSSTIFFDGNKKVHLCWADGQMLCRSCFMPYVGKIIPVLCEECGDSVKRYSRVDGKKVCGDCRRKKENVYIHHNNNEQNEQETITSPSTNYSTGSYYYSPPPPPPPIVKPEPEKTKKEDQKILSEEKRSTNNHDYLEISKKNLQKEIEKLLEDNSQIELEQDWKGQLNQLNDLESSVKYAEQTKSAILVKAQEKKQEEQITKEQTNEKSNSSLTPLIIIGGIVIGSIIFVGLMFVRKKNKEKILLW